MSKDVQILTEQAENDGYWVGVKKSPYEDDEWLLSLLFKDTGEYCYATGVTNHHFRLTTAQILELPPVADLLAACIEARANAGKYEDWLASRIGAAYDALPNDAKFSLEEFGFFELIENSKSLRAQLDAAIAKARGDEQSTD